MAHSEKNLVPKGRLRASASCRENSFQVALFLITSQMLISSCSPFHGMIAFYSVYFYSYGFVSSRRVVIRAITVIVPCKGELPVFIICVILLCSCCAHVLYEWL